MKKKHQIKTVIFDLGNVLVNFDACKAARRFSKTAKIPLMKIWHYFFTSPTEKAYTRGEISSRQFYRFACKALGMDMDFTDFRHYWNDIFWENEGMEKILVKLKKKYPLYLISNTNEMHYDYLVECYKILRHFDRKFPSHKVGARKPEPEIYKRVLKKIRFKPQETLFIDDVKSFVKGARKVGMNAIRFKNRQQLVKDLKKFGIFV